MLDTLALFFCSATTATVPVDLAPTEQTALYGWYKRCNTVKHLNLATGHYMEPRLQEEVLVEQFVQLVGILYRAANKFWR